MTIKEEQEKHIIIGGRLWTIKKDNSEHQEGRRGATFKELQEIRINPSIHPELQEVTLIHEILHACSDFVGIEDEKLTEEEWIKRIAPTLTQVIKQNPYLIDNN
jgi:Zn-dependent peptidase ImmA (M78 family)